MNQQELEKEYCEFAAKWIDKVQEFIIDFDKLSNENKRNFQKYLAQLFPGVITNFVNFLNTKI